jgi:cytochrome P450
MVVVSDPAHLRDLFATSTASFRWGHRFNVLGFIVGSTSMIVSDGDDHRRRRGKVQPAFARRRLDGWIPMIVAEADEAIDEALARAEDAFDLYPIGKSLVLKIVLHAFFGAGLRARADEFDEIFEHLQAYIELPALRQLPHPFPRTQRARARDAHERLDRLIDADIARRRALPEREDTDLLDVLIDDGADPLTDEEIRDQVNTLIGAGYNTTAASLAWTVIRALSTPGVWDELRAEADAVFADDLDGDLNADQLQRLVFARAVVQEGLRLHPAGVFSPRQAAEDVVLGGYVVPKGSMILWSPYLAGRDASVWDDPLAFIPSRHVDPDPAAAAAMESALVPFGRGPRRCIGFALAEMELVLILARMAQRLDLELQTDVVPPPYGMVVNRPSGGVPVTASPRR